MSQHEANGYCNLGIIGEITCGYKSFKECKGKLMDLDKDIFLTKALLKRILSKNDPEIIEMIKSSGDDNEDWESFQYATLSFLAGENWALKWYIRVKDFDDKSPGVRSFNEVLYMIREYTSRLQFDAYYEIDDLENNYTPFSSEELKRLDAIEMHYLSEDIDFAIEFIHGVLHALHWIIGKPLIIDELF